MIKDSFSGDSGNTNNDPFHFAKMLVLAMATSIDALAVGVTFAFFRINIIPAIAIIGVTTFGISAAGVRIGNIFGGKHRSKAEFSGGLVLILLGAKILIEHLLVLN